MSSSKSPARSLKAAYAVATLAFGLATAHAQLTSTVVELTHPAIGYGLRASTDPVVELQRRIAAGEVRLTFDPRTGFLRSLLDALEVPVESQIAVFSKTSLQAALVSPANPRTIFFNDSVVVAWMRGGFIEIAAHDPQQGAMFYVLQQTPGTTALAPDGRCLGCHYSHAALGVPGFLVRSIPTAVDGSTLPWLGNLVTDHRTPIAERWAGWYVTGRAGPDKHLGNSPLADPRAAALPAPSVSLPENLDDRFDTSGYLRPYSDVAALLVFEHQMRMMNTLTRIGWEARIALQEKRPLQSLAASVAETVDYLLFVDEAPFGVASGTSGFAEAFAARGPRDRRGRSLRELRLRGRLMEYPCSYMIYSDAFQGLAEPIRHAIYRRLWEVLSGAEQSPRYERLTAAERGAILEILTDTKNDLPDYFRSRGP